MSYRQTDSDKSDEKLLRRLLSEEMSHKGSHEIISHVFSNLIKWTYDDTVFHLTQVFNFTDEECDQLLSKYNIISSSSPETTMNPPPNFNATAPNDVKDFATNLWHARKHLLDAKKLISATALTPSDYDHQDDFQEAIVQRMYLSEKFIEINKYIDEHLDYAKHYTPPAKK